MIKHLLSLLLSGIQDTIGVAAAPYAASLAVIGTALVIGGLFTATDGGLVKKWLFVGTTANALFVAAAGLYVLSTTQLVTVDRYFDDVMWTAFAPVAITSTVAAALLLVAFFERLTDDEKPSLADTARNIRLGYYRTIAGNMPGGDSGYNMGLTVSPA